MIKRIKKKRNNINHITSIIIFIIGFIIAAYVGGKVFF
ncbi:putative membrane protein [Clostridioides difficile DA00129]|nr:putative membrane protein [Clostridioides difficile DA00129]